MIERTILYLSRVNRYFSGDMPPIVCYAIGNKQDDVKVGEWILVSHGRWSRAFKVKKDGVELEVRMIDENDILLVSETEPEQNRKQAGYVNTGGMEQMTKLPGND